MSDLTHGWTVYEHIFLDGRSYIGITGDDVDVRWKNGTGYSTQPKIRAAIDRDGWENVKHKILASDLTASEACAVEKAFIQDRDSVHNGYNSNDGGCAPRHDSFLSADILRHLRAQKTNLSLCGANDLAELIREADNNPKDARFWNDAASAIIEKIGTVDAGIDDELRWWQELMDYCNIHIKINSNQQPADRDQIKSVVYEVLAEIEERKQSTAKKYKDKLSRDYREVLGWLA